MTVVILAAGYATRLYPLTLNTPKCLLPVAGKPMLDWIGEKLKPIESIGETVIVTNAKFFDKLNDWKKKAHWPGPLRVLNDGTSSNETRLGAIGDLRLAIRQCRLDTDLLVLASDNLFKEGLENFTHFYKTKKDAICVGLHDIGDRQLASGRFGVVEVDQSWEVKGIEEKPLSPKTSFIGMGVYAFPKSSLPLVDEYLAHPHAKDAPGFYLQWLVGRFKIFGFLFSGMWYDIGNLQALKEADRAFSKVKSA